MLNQNKHLRFQKEFSDLWLRIVFLAALFLILISHILTRYIWTPRMWGIHHFFFFPDWILWLSSILILPMFVPEISDFILRLIQSIYDELAKTLTKINKSILFLLVSLMSFIIFWIFRIKLHLLGDGYWVLHFVSRGEISPYEWLDSIIHIGFFHLLSSIFSWWSLELSYAALSCLSGAIFVFVAFCMVDRLVKSKFQKMIILGLFFSCGAMQLFFGYVESYTILKMTLLCYIFCSILYLKGKLGFLLPLITLIFSILLHNVAIVFLPTLFFLLWEKKIKSRGFKSNLIFIIGVVLILTTSAILGIRFFPAVGKDVKELILPLYATSGANFTLFSQAHLTEFLNQILLISPAALVILIFFGFRTLRHKDFAEPIINFLLIGVVFSFLFLFVFDFALGSADWDFMSFPADFFILLAALLFIRWGRSWKHFNGFALLIIVISFYHTIPWILVNSNHKYSLERYVMIQENDPHPRDETNYNTMAVAMMLEQANLPQEAIRVYQNAIRRNPNDPRNYYSLAETYCRQKDFDAALVSLKKAQKIEKKNPSYVKLECIIHQWKGQREKAISCFESVANNFTDDLEFLLNLSVLCYKVDSFEKSENYIRRAMTINYNDPRAHFILSRALFKLGDFSQAETELNFAKKLVDKQPEKKAAVIQLGKLLED